MVHEAKMLSTPNFPKRKKGNSCELFLAGPNIYLTVLSTHRCINRFTVQVNRALSGGGEGASKTDAAGGSKVCETGDAAAVVCAGEIGDAAGGGKDGDAAAIVGASEAGESSALRNRL